MRRCHFHEGQAFTPITHRPGKLYDPTPASQISTISCTTDAATVGSGATGPTTPPAVGTTSSATDVDEMMTTPAPASTSAPAGGVGGDPAPQGTPAPVHDMDHSTDTMNTPSPATETSTSSGGSGDRGVVMTAAPTAAEDGEGDSGAGAPDVSSTPAPMDTEDLETESANGASSRNGGVSVVVWSATTASTLAVLALGTKVY